jgi:NADH-quinone oxidoreductase subunit J
MLAALAFYFFAFILIASAIAVIASKNPVHSVLFLILAFFNAAGLFVLLGAEFLAMILVVVYVGAVAVLFLFVVMMLDIDFADLKRGSLQYLPFGLLIGLILVAELVMAGSVWVLKPIAIAAKASATPAGVTNTEALGRILYTDYV